MHNEIDRPDNAVCCVWITMSAMNSVINRHTSNFVIHSFQWIAFNHPENKRVHSVWRVLNLCWQKVMWFITEFLFQTYMHNLVCSLHFFRCIQRIIEYTCLRQDLFLVMNGCGVKVNGAHVWWRFEKDSFIHDVKYHVYAHSFNWIAIYVSFCF